MEGFLTPLSLLMPTFALDHAPQLLPQLLRSKIDALLPRKPNRSLIRIRGFGGVFSPVTLSAQVHSTSELLRTLSRVAASKPTSWLSMRTHIVYHLTHTLGP